MKMLPIVLSLAVLLPAVSAAQPVAPQPVIVARGESTVKVAPDQAWATVSVETRDAKAPQARQLSAVAMTAVMAALKSSGVAADAIKTVGYSLNPDYEYVNGRQRMKGFLVSNQVQVRIDDITKVADVLDSVGALTLAASSNMTIANLRFDLKNRSALERDALRLAVVDAMENVKAMAAGAGATLGRIVRIDQTGRPQQFDKIEPMMAMASRGAMNESIVGTPVSPSEIEITTSVMLTVEIR
jgi:uncharacterized protein YggE